MMPFKSFMGSVDDASIDEADMEGEGESSKYVEMLNVQNEDSVILCVTKIIQTLKESLSRSR